MMNTNLEVQEFVKCLMNNEGLRNLTTSTDNKKAPVHRWFPFLAGFSHTLVEEVIRFFKLSEKGKTIFKKHHYTLVLPPQAGGAP